MKVKTLAIMAIATMMAAPANTQVKDKKTAAAARLTRGCVIKYNPVKSPIKNTVCIEYHIDKDGDGKADVVCNRICPCDEPLPGKCSPFAIVEINEVYDSKCKMWRIATERTIGTSKPANVPMVPYITPKTR